MRAAPAGAVLPRRRAILREARNFGELSLNGPHPPARVPECAAVRCACGDSSSPPTEFTPLSPSAAHANQAATTPGAAAHRQPIGLLGLWRRVGHAVAAPYVRRVHLAATWRRRAGLWPTSWPTASARRRSTNIEPGTDGWNRLQELCEANRRAARRIRRRHAPRHGRPGVPHAVASDDPSLLRSFPGRQPLVIGDGVAPIIEAVRRRRRKRRRRWPRAASNSTAQLYEATCLALAQAQRRPGGSAVASRASTAAPPSWSSRCSKWAW